MTPTINNVMEMYRLIAQAERAKTGRPSQATVTNVLRGTTLVCAAAQIPLSSEITSITRKRIDRALSQFISRGLSRMTALSYVTKLQSLLAKWTLPYYKDEKWEIPILELPTFRAKAPRYIRPSDEILTNVKEWYMHLHREHWLAATMMLEFAMRNNDVLMIDDSCFICKQGIRYLQYTPHKTELSSGRRVCWPVHKDIWKRISSYGGIKSLNITQATFNKINSDLRALGFSGPKASYELRKICIDHIYQKFGAEMAVSISGDDIRTIIRYYADPSQPNIGEIRICDLF